MMSLHRTIDHTQKLLQKMTIACQTSSETKNEWTETFLILQLSSGDIKWSIHTFKWTMGGQKREGNKNQKLCS